MLGDREAFCHHNVTRVHSVDKLRALATCGKTTAKWSGSCCIIESVSYDPNLTAIVSIATDYIDVDTFGRGAVGQL